MKLDRLLGQALIWGEKNNLYLIPDLIPLFDVASIPLLY